MKMISFACKRITKEELIRCSFDLSKTQYKVFIALMHKSGEIKDIKKITNLDRTTIQKAIIVLINKNLVKRKKENKAKGGFSYVYSIKNKELIKQRMKTIVKSWADSVLKSIERF